MVRKFVKWVLHLTPSALGSIKRGKCPKMGIFFSQNRFVRMSMTTGYGALEERDRKGSIIWRGCGLVSPEGWGAPGPNPRF